MFTKTILKKLSKFPETLIERKTDSILMKDSKIKAKGLTPRSLPDFLNFSRIARRASYALRAFSDPSVFNRLELHSYLRGPISKRRGFWMPTKNRRFRFPLYLFIREEGGFHGS